MRALAASLLTLSLLAGGPAAAATPTDDEARTAYIVEYTSMRSPIIAMIGKWRSATSAPEKAAQMLEIENAVEVTIAYLESLTPAPCYALLHRVTLIEFDAVADAIAASRIDGVPVDFSVPSTAFALLNNDIFLNTLNDCSRVA